METNTSCQVDVTLDGKARSLKTFPRIGVGAFQHSDDRNASEAVSSLPVIPQLYKFWVGNRMDQVMRMEHLTSSMRIGPNQGAELYKKFVLAAQILDLPQLPELYLCGDTVVNAFACGTNNPIVVLNHGILSILSEGELLAIIGHELGHVKCGHCLNHSLAHIFASAGIERLANMFPIVGNAALIGAQAALSYWSRMAEFSCDRAALLVVQDGEIVARALSKLAGFHEKFVTDFNFETLLKQIDEYEAYDQDLIQSLVKLQSVINDREASHPHTVLRVKRVLDWAKSDHFNDILGGEYVRDTTPISSSYAGSNSKKCPQCGNFMPPDAGFCSRCGQKLL